jgi:hypothetical protein
MQSIANPSKKQVTGFPAYTENKSIPDNMIEKWNVKRVPGGFLWAMGANPVFYTVFVVRLHEDPS